MTDFADADLVVAIVKPTDHLKVRAQRHLQTHRLRIPFSVGIELLFVARKHGASCGDFLGAAQHSFDLEDADVLLAAAEALDAAELTTVFDAVHAAQALVSGVKLHTTDRRLLASEFPTQTF